MEVQIPYQEMQKTPGPGALFFMVCSSKYFWVEKKNVKFFVSQYFSVLMRWNCFDSSEKFDSYWSPQLASPIWNTN